MTFLLGQRGALRFVPSFHRILVRTAASAAAAKVDACYRTLNLQSDCSDDEMKEAYFRLAKEYHPDSTSTVADTVKFTQIEESYRYLVAQRKKCDEEGDYTMEEHQEFYDIKHTAPQHRQYLSNEGFGHGTPSQRNKQHQRYKFAKATEAVFEHQFNKEKAQSETAVVEKDKHLTRQRTTRSTIDRVVDDYISEAMRRGDFDNLTGSGKPLKRDFNPMVDGFTRHINKMLINNGYAPEWITLDKDIRDDIKRARERLWSFRRKLGPEPWPEFSVGLWRNYTHDFTAIVEEDINKRVDRFNLLVPALHLQVVRYDPKREIDKIMRKYETFYAIGECSTETNPDIGLSQPQTVVNHQNFEPLRWREIWKHIKALFSREPG